eukprot:SAG31_NODE_459_length_15396_cov_5.092502_13_plen_116_part_00
MVLHDLYNSIVVSCTAPVKDDKNEYQQQTNACKECLGSVSSFFGLFMSSTCRSDAVGMPSSPLKKKYLARYRTLEGRRVSYKKLLRHNLVDFARAARAVRLNSSIPLGLLSNVLM